MRPSPLLQPQMGPLQVVHVANVELAQKLPRRRRREYRLGLQQLLRPGVAAQPLKVAQILAPKTRW